VPHRLNRADRPGEFHIVQYSYYSFCHLFNRSSSRLVAVAKCSTCWSPSRFACFIFANRIEASGLVSRLTSHILAPPAGFEPARRGYEPLLTMSRVVAVRYAMPFSAQRRQIWAACAAPGYLLTGFKPNNSPNEPLNSFFHQAK
jgi:hypothetical protein